MSQANEKPSNNPFIKGFHRLKNFFYILRLLSCYFWQLCWL